MSLFLNTYRANKTPPLLWKGIGLLRDGHVAEDTDTLNLSWYYDWINRGTPEGPSAPPWEAGVTGSQYVPMMWGDWELFDEPGPAASLFGSKILLGFNEPDIASQSDMTAARALALWPEMEACGARLGSPAVSCESDSLDWLADFMAGDPHVDFICVHWYEDLVAADLDDYIDALYSTYKKPIWITECGTLAGGVSANAALIPTVMDILSTRPWVERIAWFMGREPVGSAWPNTGLINSSGVITAAGTVYAGYPAKINFAEPTYPIPPLDNFNRADNASMGVPWEPRNTTVMRITSNRAVPTGDTTDTTMRYGDWIHGESGYVQAKVRCDNGFAGIQALITLPFRNEVEFIINPDGNFRLVEHNNGTEVFLDTTAGAGDVEYLMRMEWEIGETTTLLRGYVDGVLTCEGVTSNHITPGNVGISSYRSSGTLYFDDFEAGDLVDTVPNAPTALEATAGNAQVSLAWTAPVYDGGEAITDYRVQWRTTTGPGSWNTFTDGTSTTTSATVTGLTNGTSYDFQVAAINSIGVGAYSATDTATPTVSVPSDFVDTFNRANGAIGSDYEAIMGNALPVISSNGMAGSAAGWVVSAARHIASMTTDHFIEVTVDSLPVDTGIDLLVRIDTSGNGYAGFIYCYDLGAGPQISFNISQVDGLVNTALGTESSIARPAYPFTFRLEAEGTALRHYVNDVLRISVTDPTYTSETHAGVLMYGDSSVPHVDQMEGGPYVPPGPTTPPSIRGAASSDFTSSTIPISIAGLGGVAGDRVLFLLTSEDNSGVVINTVPSGVIRVNGTAVNSAADGHDPTTGEDLKVWAFEYVLPSGFATSYDFVFSAFIYSNTGVVIFNGASDFVIDSVMWEAKDGGNQRIKAVTLDAAEICIAFNCSYENGRSDSATGWPSASGSIRGTYLRTTTIGTDTNTNRNDPNWISLNVIAVGT